MNVNFNRDEKRLPLVGITMGDPCGIGPEIIVKLINDGKIFEQAELIVIGDGAFLEKKSHELGIPLTVHRLKNTRERKQSDNRQLNVIDLANTHSDITLGEPNPAGGQASVEFIKTGVELAMAGDIEALTTAPISKEAINLAGYKYAGHTEMLGDLTGTTDFVMMLTGGGIKVVLATTHLAINQVSDRIKKESLLKTIRVTDKALSYWYRRKPVIGVASLNPHGGEGGLFGMEEIEEIIPAIKEALKEGINLSGPYPADSLFSQNKRSKFDVILVMYHDQGLIPIKMAAFGNAVNVTLGLPFIRTSVDHGTAYDIVAKNIAGFTSLYQAVVLSSEILKMREKGDYQKL